MLANQPNPRANESLNSCAEIAKHLIVKYIGAAEGMGVAILNQDGRHIYFNPEYRKILQLDQETLYPNVRFEAILENELSDEESAQEWLIVAKEKMAEIDHKLKVGSISKDQMNVATSDGRTLQLNQIFTEDHFMVMTVKDISEEEREKKLFQMSMETARAGYWAYNFETEEFSFSKSVKDRLSERELKRIEQTGLWAIMETEDLPIVMKEWTAMVNGGDEIDLTYRVTTEMDGTMWQRSVGKVQYTDAGKRSAVIAFVTDITADVKTNEALVAAEEASRGKSDFLARMSHEVKTPLNAIVGMTDALKDEDLPADAQETLTLILQSAEHLNELLTQTLDHTNLLSEKKQINLFPESPAEIVKEVCAFWRPKCANKGLDLKLEIDPDLPASLSLDRFHIQECLSHLLSNAVKFTNCGHISVTAKYLQKHVTRTLVFIIRDTGVGMSEEFCQSAFTPFEQGDTSITRNFGGTGLGLTITKQLVELMGGQISLRSMNGEGTAFAIGIPVEAAENEETAMQEKAVEVSKSGPEIPPKLVVDKSQVDVEDLTLSSDTLDGLSILCVEDNPTNQHVVKKLIGKKVALLQFANNGREALDKLAQTSFDIILMDIHMPVMDGIEATIKIRNSEADWADVIIIALTADSDYQQVRICRNLGMNDTIGKPVKRKDILDAFDRVLTDVSIKHGKKVKLSAA